MKKIYGYFHGEGLKFGFPYIGAGLAGGDWEIIKSIIEEEMKGEDITFVKYKKEM